MARFLAALVLCSGALYVTAQDKAGLCPLTAPSSSSSSKSCSADSGCPSNQKCCTYNSNMRCTDPVIPNYQATFYIAGLPQETNENSLIKSYAETTFANTGTIADIEVERLGTCVRVFVSLQTQNEALVDIKMTALENDPVSINTFTGGPFYVTSHKNQSLCPDAIANFNARLYILGVNGSATTSQAKSVLDTAIGDVGKGWEFGAQEAGECLEIFLEAVLTSEEEVTVMNVLDDLEENGITLVAKTPPFKVTSSNDEAESCYASFFKNDCDAGKRFCPYRKHCILETAFCDGIDDCGDSSDELNCKCGAGQRACADGQLCVTESALCDGKHDCTDHSDEQGCYFETYGVNVTLDSLWNSQMDNSQSSTYTRFTSAVETYMNDAFLPLSNYSHTHVLAFRPTADNKMSLAVDIVFRGHMDPAQVQRKQSDVLSGGIVYGIISIGVTSIQPVASGPCARHECLDGVCVETNSQADCRCLPGQDPDTCQLLDCRGEEDYCGANNTKGCVYTPRQSGYACRCPPGLAGTRCDIDVCAQLGGSVCSVNGQCYGDLYNFTLCTCNSLFAGPFCGDRGTAGSDTLCRRQSQLANMFLQHLTGGDQVSQDFLNGNTLPQQLGALGYQQLEVPTCTDGGEYHHMCVYNISAVFDGSVCYCTNNDGTFNGLDYNNGQCGSPNTFDPDEKPGVCPTAEVGSAIMACREDQDCDGDRKCCRVGAGRQCKAPLTVKAGECPAPQQGITTWRCDSDGECQGALKCCREDKGQLCRHPLYVTRFQVDVTLNAQWKNTYSNLDSLVMRNLRDKLQEHFADLKGFVGLTLLLAASGSGKVGSVKVSVEVVASPEVSREDVQQKVTSLPGKQFRFDNVVRLVSNASLVTHELCGSQDCGGGSCVNTTRGAKCLCAQGLYGDRCQFSNLCMAGLCQNGGTCVGTATTGETGLDYQYSCLCGPGFMGDTCEVSVCNQLPPELCNSGTCLGDLTGGALCSCPLDRRGIFCQDNGTEMPYTECELRKRLNNYIADVLKGKTTMAGMNLNGVKNLLLSLGVEWLPLLTCQHGGAYTLTAEVLSVTDRSTTRHICLDRHGEEEVDCQSKVCSTVGTICQNNGTCVGNINLQLCHCAGTGHHGAVCDKPGEEEPTDCQQRHDLAQLTLDALSGNLQVKGMTGQTAKTTITSLLSDIHRDTFWQPDCTKGGSHAYRGCEFRVPDTSSKRCFCVDDMNERLEGTPASSSGLPECPVAGACSEFSSEPCGAHGKCVGDLNAGALCECDQDYSGIMCQVNSPDTLTDCQRRGRLANYLLSIMSGYEQPPPELSGTVQQLLSRAGMTRLEVPTCGSDGFYRYTCTYTVDSLVLDGCRCTNDDGTYTSDEASCDVLEKPGECPETEPATPGVPRMECESDNRCNDSQKCCPVGSGRQCLNPVLVSTFQVNVTVNAPYSQFSSARADLLTQLGDVFGTLPGFIAVTIVQATQGSIKLTVKVKAAVDVTAADIDNTLNRLRAAQFTLTSSTLYDVTSVVFVAGGACEDVQCGPGMCVDTSYGARCVCPVGTSGNMCQYSMLPCNCSAGQQCVRGTHPDTLACSCYPQNDATCRMPLWFCDGKADCRVSEKCVHREDCDVVSNGNCDVKSRCIPLSESEACDSQPCQHGALCVTKNDGSYRCQCKQGFSGSYCEENVGVCNVVPDKVCTHGCVGDAHVGVLCQCPHGRGGINCDQPAHSPCEQQHALFSDMLKISKSSLSVPGVTQTQLYNMMTQIMTHIDAQDLPLTNCTSDGGFSPVQCKVNLRSQAETCHCVNQDGTPISSNVLAYPGFPACTAPYSPELAGEMLCSTTLSNVCRNGGRCVGNLLNGTLCQCDPGYSGILCQDRAGAAQAAPLPRSLCEISLAVWQLMQRSLTSGDRSLMTELYRLQDKLFHASTNLPSQMIKASCAQDGHFQHVQCVYNLRTDSPVACYCINPRGVVLHSRTAWPAKPDCDEIDSCPKPACSLTDCEHGLAQDIHGCDVCQCKHPCDGECDHDPGMRCVVEKQEECGRDSWEGACTSGVCRKREKSGMCPASVSANLTSLDTLKSSAIASCDVTCLDDADCPANLKCCGVCGMQCVQPVDHTCNTHSTSATREHQYLKQVKAAVQKGQVNLNAASRILRAKLQSIKAMTATWIPACDASGFYRLTQCKTSLTNSATAGCFCVDRHGNHIPGTNAATRAGTNCEAKPGLCPFLQPNATTIHDCDSDYDCHDNNKCCPHGLGSMCVAPVKELGSAISLDHVIDGACSFAANLCGIRGACVRRWFTEGRVCACNSGSHGVFCQKSGSEPGDMTACKRRKEMQDYLLDNPSKLDIFLARARKEFGNNRPFKLTFPDCLADGSFAPTQCNRNLDSRQVVDCYCVDTNGKPLEGTHVEGEQTPVCARQNPCDVGAPLHHLGNQTAVTCGGQAGKCAPGYVCQAGRYARLYCCRDRLSDVDVCLLPPTPGHDCPFFEGGAREVTEQRFYFDAVAKRCRALTYKGCAEFKSNFPTLAACEARCVKKEHQGRCPARTVVAERAVCTDACRSDADCQESHKCCSASCGRRCVLALNSEDEVCEVGEALQDTELSQPKRCSADSDCGAAYRCTSNVCCLRRVDNVCEQPEVVGPCRASLSRYHYNPATKQCELFVYGGCGANDNSFLTKDDCCNACGEKGRCKDGVCPAPRPVLSMSCDHSCYGDGDCPSNQICCNSSCGGSACVIAEPSTESTVSCTDALANYHQRLAQANGCFLTYKPRCDQHGRWEREQCSDRLGVCWCVSHNGFVVPGTRVRGVAQCQWVTPAMMAEADKKGLKGDDTSNTDQCQVCPGGEEVSCCDQDLCLQVCAADPSATCRVNPCGGCSAVFYNADNNVVNCEQGLTDCQLRRQEALRARYKYGVVSMATEIRSQKMVPGTRMAGSDKGQVPYIVDGVPSKCQLLPDTGTCRAHVTQWFYNVTSQRCEVFVYGLCGGNENRFHTVDECYEHCNPEASPCFAVPCNGKVCQVSHTQNCFSGHCGQARTCGANNGNHVVRDVYVPQCTNNGGYSLRQCHDHLCWCVLSDGSYNQGLTSHITSLQCTLQGPVTDGKVGAGESVGCPANTSSARVECMDRCQDAVCPGHPDARCVIDLCACQHNFVGHDGSPVVCKGDACQTDVFTRAEKKCPSDKVCGGVGPEGCEYSDPCRTAVCSSNPCAVCVSDPCTGLVSFMDTLTGKQVKQQDCNKVTHTHCELRKCEVVSMNTRASHNDTLLPLPQCDDDGSYLPQQRRADNTLYCVDDFGEPVESETSECVKDPLVRVTVAVIYEGDFDTIVPGREGKITVAFEELLVKIGLLRAMITNVKVRRGSIVLETDIVDHPDSPMELAVVKPLIQSKAASGELTLRVDGITLTVARGEEGGVVVTPTTASQVQSPVDQGGLGAGGVAAIVIVLIIIAAVGGGAAFYFLYYKRRQPKPADSLDSTFHAPKAGQSKGTVEGVDNNAFDMHDSGKRGEDYADHYVKVRL